MSDQPRHTDWRIEPDGKYAAEERREEVPLSPIVGNGMVGGLEYNKKGKMGGVRAGSQFVAVSTAAHLHPCLPQPARHHSAANTVSGGTSTRALKGRKKKAAGKAIRPLPAGTDARTLVAAWNMPTPPRGSVAAGIGAARAKRSKADSPTATTGSRAAQIKN